MWLPNDGPLVLSGHQAELWHGGILAKHFASLAYASRVGAQAAWIVVDQDEADALGMRIPVRDSTGRLRDMRWHWGHGAGRIADAIAPLTVPEPTLKPGESFALSSVADGVRSVAVSLAKHAEEPSWAKQVSAAAADLIARSAPTPRFVFESRMPATELFQQILDALIRGGPDAVRGYNRAISVAPESGMRPLDETRHELPVWDVRGGRRKRVYLADVGTLDRTQVAPRGMLMTAVLRLAGCDLFVHGMGGGVYDRATEAWVANWRGDLATLAKELGGVLAPMAIATADLRLPIAKPGLPTGLEIRRGVWMAHHASHDPRLLGDERGAMEKDRLVAEIREKKAKHENPAPVFAELHALLAQSRRAGAARLAQFQEAAKRLTELQSEAALAFDRTWSFALQSPTAIETLYKQALGRFQIAN